MTQKQWKTSNNVYTALTTLRGVGEFGFSVSGGIVQIDAIDLNKAMRVLACAVEMTETRKFTVKVLSLKNMGCVLEVSF